LVAVARLLGEQNQRGSPDVAAPRAAAPSSATRAERPERTAESERTATETATERTAERGWAELATAASAMAAVPMLLGVVVRESFERKIGAPGVTGVTERAPPTAAGRLAACCATETGGPAVVECMSA
jgi:hypothetical protein